MIFTIGRVFKYALQNFIRNFWLSVATLLVMVILIMLINVIVSVNQVKTSVLSSVNNKIDLALFFKPQVPEAEVLSLKDELEKNTAVQSVKIVTPAEGLEQLKNAYPRIGERVVPSLDTNPLGYKLEIRTVSLDQFTQLLDGIEKNSAYANKLENHTFVDSREIATSAAALSEKINVGAIALALVLGFIALIIIFNAIRVSIYSHRDEIAIMKLVGATNQFIRMPFLIEACIYTVVAIGIVMAILLVLLQAAQPYLNGFFEGLTVVNLFDYYRTNAFSIFGLELAGMLILNLLSTGLALRRYLRA